MKRIDQVTGDRNSTETATYIYDIIKDACDLANEVTKAFGCETSMVQKIGYPHDSDSYATHHLNSDVEDSSNYTQPTFVSF